MSWADPTTPNLPDYTLFVSGIMDIDPLYLPPESPFIQYALDRALALVICTPVNRGIEYTLAVYNCAGHIQIQITPDQDQRDYFKTQRKEYGLLRPSFGVVASTSDEATSTSLATPDALKQLTISDLGFMKTPWGREYLSYNQDFGGIWGLS